MEKIVKTLSRAKNLACSNCGEAYQINQLHTFATCCQKPLTVQYEQLKLTPSETIDCKENSMWRYAAMLPLFNMDSRISLGEGMTPILSLNKIGEKYGFSNLQMKDEGLNPTGSFKARGISMAVSKAHELGVKECIIPTAGNAGGALSAYCAAAGIKCTVVMPKDTPSMFKEECERHGAKLVLIDGLINQCGQVANELQAQSGAFNIATMKEPYRLEGKKTMGYEIAEQMDWNLPDVILYPTGGGTGLIGIWKAFQEMIEMGWLPSSIKLPRMIAVQTTQCQPIVDAFNGVAPDRNSYKMSIANGLSVPVAFGEDMIMRVLAESGGTAISVSDQKILAGATEIGSHEGILISPEGAAIWEALKLLSEDGLINKDERILLLNTGNGYKYMENFR